VVDEETNNGWLAARASSAKKQAEQMRIRMSAFLGTFIPPCLLLQGDVADGVGVHTELIRDGCGVSCPLRTVRLVKAKMECNNAVDTLLLLGNEAAPFSKMVSFELL